MRHFYRYFSYLDEILMTKEQKKFQYIEHGVSLPIYTVFAISEKMALKKLYKYLGKIGKQDINVMLIGIGD